MKTIKKPSSVKWRPTVNCGGRPRYGGVELSVYPTQKAEVDIILDCKDDGNWFNALKEGFDTFMQKTPLIHCRIVVNDIHWHSVDTSHNYMISIGRNALFDIFERQGMEWKENKKCEPSSVPLESSSESY